jgi:hypothetical protein
MNGRVSKHIRNIAAIRTVGAPTADYTVKYFGPEKRPQIRLKAGCTRLEIKQIKRRYRARRDFVKSTRI